MYCKKKISLYVFKYQKKVTLGMSFEKGNHSEVWLETVFSSPLIANAAEVTVSTFYIIEYFTKMYSKMLFEYWRQSNV